ncbi:MAG: LON peptidase substrate-binding domain-containing protein [Candidatus Acidiferrales bacterium]
MAKPNRIPLFPLDVVLLPSMSLPLHIFEERYKLMIQRCLDEHLGFGMVLASGHNVASVGCIAEIIRRIKDYPDGRVDILTEGRSVFHLTQVLEEKQYYEGIVEYPDEVDSPLDPSQEARLIELLQQCYALLFGQPWADPEPGPSNILAYRMAARLPIELKERQALLEMRAEGDRREFLLAWLVQFLPKLAGRQRARQRAGGNGHGLVN